MVQSGDGANAVGGERTGTRKQTERNDPDLVFHLLQFRHLSLRLRIVRGDLEELLKIIPGLARTSARGGQEK